MAIIKLSDLSFFSLKQLDLKFISDKLNWAYNLGETFKNLGVGLSFVLSMLSKALKSF